MFLFSLNFPCRPFLLHVSTMPETHGRTNRVTDQLQHQPAKWQEAATVISTEIRKLLHQNLVIHCYLAILSASFSVILLLPSHRQRAYSITSYKDLYSLEIERPIFNVSMSYTPTMCQLTLHQCTRVYLDV